MLINLLSDLTKDSQLQEEFAVSPQEVLERYEVQNPEILKEEGMEGILQMIKSEMLSEDFVNKNHPIVFYPPVQEIQLTSVSPDSFPSSSPLKELKVSGSGFEFGEFVLREFYLKSPSAKKIYSTTEFKITSNIEVDTNFQGAILEPGIYSLELVYLDKQRGIKIAKLAQALTVTA